MSGQNDKHINCYNIIVAVRKEMFKLELLFVKPAAAIVRCSHFLEWPKMGICVNMNDGR